MAAMAAGGIESTLLRITTAESDLPLAGQTFHLQDTAETNAAAIMQKLQATTAKIDKMVDSKKLTAQQATILKWLTANKVSLYARKSAHQALCQLTEKMPNEIARKDEGVAIFIVDKVLDTGTLNNGAIGAGQLFTFKDQLHLKDQRQGDLYVLHLNRRGQWTLKGPDGDAVTYNAEELKFHFTPKDEKITLIVDGLALVVDDTPETKTKAVGKCMSAKDGSRQVLRSLQFSAVDGFSKNLTWSMTGKTLMAVMNDCGDLNLGDMAESGVVPSFGGQLLISQENIHLQRTMIEVGIYHSDSKLEQKQMDTDRFKLSMLDLESLKLRSQFVSVGSDESQFAQCLANFQQVIGEDHDLFSIGQDGLRIGQSANTFEFDPDDFCMDELFIREIDQKDIAAMYSKLPGIKPTEALHRRYVELLYRAAMTGYGHPTGLTMTKMAAEMDEIVKDFLSSDGMKGSTLQNEFDFKSVMQAIQKWKADKKAKGTGDYKRITVGEALKVGKAVINSGFLKLGKRAKSRALKAELVKYFTEASMPKNVSAVRFEKIVQMKPMEQSKELSKVTW